MAKQHLLMLGFIVGGSLAFQACSSDSDSGKTSTGNEAGAKGEAGSTGEAGAAGSGAFVFPDALDPTSIVVAAEAPATLNHLVVAGTDFTTTQKTQVVTVTLDTAKVGAAALYDDSDAIAASSGGLGFVLERSNDKVNLLDGDAIKATFDLTETGDATAAPVTNKAYVGLYNQSLISILDLDTGKVSRRIDLSEFNDARDSDHSADIGDGVYDASKKIAYFSLARIDRNSIAAPDYHLPCTATKGLIVGIDTTTDEIVDLNGSAAGKGIELSLVSQSTIALSADGKSLIVLAAGCYDGATLKNGGVEVVDIEGASSQVVYASKNDDYLGRLITLDGSNALLGTFDSVGDAHWYKLDLAAGKLGAELMDVPGGVSFDGTDLLGVASDGAIVRYTIETGTAKNITDSSLGADYSSALTTALVK